MSETAFIVVIVYVPKFAHLQINKHTQNFTNLRILPFHEDKLSVQFSAVINKNLINILSKYNEYIISHYLPNRIHYQTPFAFKDYIQGPRALAHKYYPLHASIHVCAYIHTYLFIYRWMEDFSILRTKDLAVF